MEYLDRYCVIVALLQGSPQREVCHKVELPSSHLTARNKARAKLSRSRPTHAPTTTAPTMSSRQWIKGTTVRKGGAATSSHPSRHLTPTVQSTSSTVFGGGVKDPSGRTSEYSVSVWGVGWVGERVADIGGNIVGK